MGQVISDILLDIGVLAHGRHAVHRHDHVEAAQRRRARGVKHGAMGRGPTVMTVVMPLSFRIFARPVSLSPSMNLSTNETMTGSLPLGATAGRVSPITGAGTLGPAVGTRV